MIQLTEVTQNKPATPSYFVVGINLKSLRPGGEIEILVGAIDSDINWDEVWEQVGNSQHHALFILDELPVGLSSIQDLITEYKYSYANGVITFTQIDDTQHRINWINRINSIDEPIFRDMLNFMYLSDVQSAQLEILTGAIERAFQACADGTLTQVEVDDVINSRKALKKPNITEKSLESEALYFRHCLMIEFVRGLGSGRKHDEGIGNTIYNHARAVADYVMPLYYDIDNQYLPTGQRILTTTFLDPSATMTNKLILQRKVVTAKALAAINSWAGTHDKDTHFVDHNTQFIRPQSEHESGELTDAGKANLRAAIELADPTRVEQENDNE